MQSRELLVQTTLSVKQFASEEMGSRHYLTLLLPEKNVALPSVHSTNIFSLPNPVWLPIYLKHLSDAAIHLRFSAE